MTALELKNAILLLAMQGKLVQQNPDDEPATLLVKRIDTEIAALISEGKIKKIKPLSELKDEDLPFDIPETWCWRKLGSLCQLLDGEKTSGKEYPYLEAKYLRGKANATVLEEGKLVHKGTRLILVDGENSGEVFVAIEDGYMGSTFKVLFYPQSLCEHYVRFFLQFKQPAFRNNKTGSAIPHLNKELFFNTPFPIPPYEEQKRIAAKIDELMPLVEEYGKAEEQLTALNAEFPEKLRRSILQQAIQGKLTERDPADEPAAELLKRIRADKEKLIKEGKIKKEKPLPPITTDEIPFEIPKNWIWVRLQELADTIVDCPHSTPVYLEEKTGYHAIGTKCMNGKGEITHLFNVDEETYRKRIERLEPQKNDIVYSREGSIVCRAVILPDNTRICLGQRVMLIRCPKGVLQRYMQLYLMADQTVTYLTQNYKGAAAKHINVADVCRLPVPLPPIAEQQRFVVRVNELLDMCDELKGCYE